MDGSRYAATGPTQPRLVHVMDMQRQVRRSIVPAFDVEAIATIIREVAETVIMPRWRNLAAHEIGSKSRSSDIVTVADHEAESVLTTRLAALLPGSRVVGEEAVAANPTVLEALSGEGVVWVIDPIDGTRKFAAGSPDFDVLVALLVDGAGVAGWIHAPAENRMIMGEAGAGVVLRDAAGELRPVRRQPSRRLADLKGIVSPGGFSSRGYRSPEEVRGRFAGFTRHLCAGHNYARLLTGESDFLVNFSTLPWDHLAGLTLAAEAGFYAARHDGKPFDPRDPTGGLIVAPGAAAWHEIRALLLRPA